MKKILIDAPLEYVTGHLRYGHLEGTITITDEEFEKFKENPIVFLYDNECTNELNLVIDDWGVDGYGPIDRVEWSECKS